MELNVTILGSGSRGNAILIHNKEEAILVDAGFSLKELKRRIELSGNDITKIKAVLLTHAHSDHVSGLFPLVKHLKIPYYVSRGTYDIFWEKGSLKQQENIFDVGDSFQHSSFFIKTFSVSHDIGEPVGFVINSENYKIGIATDLGVVDKTLVNSFKDCNAVILESNHDEKMLADSDRHQVLKDRIASKKGHLSNGQCAEALIQIVTSNTSHVVLCHISGECNKPELALQASEEALRSFENVSITVACQNEITSIKL